MVGWDRQYITRAHHQSSRCHLLPTALGWWAQECLNVCIVWNSACFSTSRPTPYKYQLTASSTSYSTLLYSLVERLQVIAYSTVHLKVTTSKFRLPNFQLQLKLPNLNSYGSTVRDIWKKDRQWENGTCLYIIYVPVLTHSAGE